MRSMTSQARKIKNKNKDKDKNKDKFMVLCLHMLGLVLITYVGYVF